MTKADATLRHAVAYTVCLTATGFSSYLCAGTGNTRGTLLTVTATAKMSQSLTARAKARLEQYPGKQYPDTNTDVQRV